MALDRASLDARLKKEVSGNPAALRIFERLAENEAFNAGCDMANAVAVSRLGYNDHGRVHVRITALNALAILNILGRSGVSPNFVKEKHGTFGDAQVVVMLGALLHDLGNAIHRKDHEKNGVYLAGGLLDEVLPEFYSGPKLHKIRLFVLGCVFETGDGADASSVESGAVKIADGADCEKGRARMPYRLFGKPDIHSVSALAIKRVEIGPGKEVPVRITVDMTNPAGLFQVSEVLGKKIAGSGLKSYVEVDTRINGRRLRETDVSLL
ncbi:MAG: HD domain-containing protein [Candidatus ainarchaeum sp.]|nr:HD domain-containing protein [Candidatus ainarchaeum sp.]